VIGEIKFGDGTAWDHWQKLAADRVKTQKLWLLDKVRSVEKGLANELPGTIGNPWRRRCQSGGGSHLGTILTKQIAGQKK